MNDKQSFLPGMEPAEDQVARKIKLRRKTLKCAKCFQKEATVVWNEKLNNFACWSCGQVCTKSTKKFCGD